MNEAKHIQKTFVKW